MPLRSTPALTVPTIGPRSRAEAAPQRIGKRVGVPLRPGWEVRRMWPERLLFVIVFRGSKEPPQKRKTSRATIAEREAQQTPVYRAKMSKNQAFAARAHQASPLRASSMVIIR